MNLFAVSYKSYNILLILLNYLILSIFFQLYIFKWNHICHTLMQTAFFTKKMINLKNILIWILSSLLHERRRNKTWKEKYHFVPYLSVLTKFKFKYFLN